MHFFPCQILLLSEAGHSANFFEAFFIQPLKVREKGSFNDGRQMYSLLCLFVY